MPIIFDKSTQYDRSVSQTVEGAFKAYGSWAGIHDFKFDSLVSIESITVTGATGWSAYELIDTPLPVDIELSYTVDGPGHGVLLRYLDAENYTIFGVTEGNHAIVRDVVAGTPVLLYDMAITCPSEGDVTISYRQQRYSDDETDLWDTFSMWMNDRLIATFIQFTGAPLAFVPKAGLVAHNSAREFTDIRIPLLTEYTEWSSLDPGENPMGGLQRAIDGRYTKFFMRFDGSLRAWRSTANATKHTFTPSRSFRSFTSYDKRELVSHVRMLGAYIIAEAIRRDLIQQVGHRFAEVNNPYIMSAEEARMQAAREIQRREEAALTEEIATTFRPLLEPEDHITTPGGERILTSMNISVDATGYVKMEAAARRYVFGS